MRRTFAGAVLLACLMLLPAGAAVADIVCPDSSYCTVSFSCTYTGLYRPGQPRDYLTVEPHGTLETFASAGITIRVYVKNCSGVPLVGVPQQDILLFNSSLCMCPGGNGADAATDVNGCATFTGSLKAAGCASGLKVFADGVLVGTVPVNVNSVAVVHCSVDSDAIASWAGSYGSRVGVGNYNICKDFNEDGVIDISDFAILASALGNACQ